MADSYKVMLSHASSNLDTVLGDQYVAEVHLLINMKPFAADFISIKTNQGGWI